MSGGKGKIGPKDGKLFSKDNQPTGEAKSLGKKKKALIKDICAQIITGDAKESFQGVADYLGLSIEEIDFETAMHLKQLEKAIKKGDTTAYNAIMDRTKGKPVQAIQMEDMNIKPIITKRVK
ncbi:hypothetical protein [Aquimarina intermedia]|uniref:Uncharacterized protein n=1 Tax=Aquimarina intermedia TaxID=350814 RepID=A0A5S5BWT6_9FLAO|nr:hypothetical protein [Aquimarina intermedia]TYP71497.1 hypothetical protein BD809_10979 [Aquimarina intermedia]